MKARGRKTNIIKGICVVTLAVLFSGIFNGPATARAGEALQSGQELVHLDFEDGSTQGCATYTNGGSCDISGSDGCLAVDIHSCGNLDYANQVYWDGFALSQNCVYTYSFDISSDIPRDVEYRLQMNGGDYHAYMGEVITVGPQPEKISVDWTMTEESDPAPRLVFNLGKMGDMEADPGEHQVRIDNITLSVKDASQAVVPEGLPEPPLVTVSQVGYRPEDEKILVVSDDSEEGSFTVRNADTEEAVLEGGFEKAVYNPATDTRVKTADFSGLTEPGTYYIHVISGNREADSYKFMVAEDVYSDLYRSVVHMLYLQRCGTGTEEALAGTFAHEACHTEEALIYGTDQKKEVSGGWHDAGDYGRYVVSGAKTAADLLLAFEEYGLTEDDLGIPESGNGVPDLLDEVRFELDWMLKMQDPQTGGVYHKVTGYTFPGDVPPQEETEPLVLAPVSTAATGDFAALMAKASVLWKDLDPEFSGKALSAAYQAWEYIRDLDDTNGFTNPPEIVTGEYPDRGTADEIFWAAAELFLAGDDTMADELTERYSTYLRPGLGWNRMTSYAYYDLLKASLQGIDDVLEGCRKQILEQADEILKDSEKDVYGSALKKDYPWGSNMTVANNGITLLMAERLTGDEKYRALARKQLDYLLGCNGLGICFVSGFGTVSPEHPHHRPSLAAGKVMPGMLAGGPNSHLEDPYAKGVLSGRAPALCYADNAQSYSTNEVAVYWNSPLIGLAAAFQADM